MLSRSTSAEPRDNAARYLVCGRTLREDDRIRAMVALIDDFQAGTAVTLALCAIAVYVVGCDAAIRFVRSLNA